MTYYEVRAEVGRLLALKHLSPWSLDPYDDSYVRYDAVGRRVCWAQERVDVWFVAGDSVTYPTAEEAMLAVDAVLVEMGYVLATPEDAQAADEAKYGGPANSS